MWVRVRYTLIMESPEPAPVLCMTGSIVTGCFVSRLVQVEADLIRGQGVEVATVELDELDLPVFHERIEREGLPEGALLLKRLLARARVIVVGAPELNDGLTSVLKNAIDWASRPGPGEQHRGESFAGASAVIISASKHVHAGIRGADLLRNCLVSLGVTVLPEHVAVPRAPEAFHGGQLDDADAQADLQGMALAVVAELAIPRRRVHQMTWAERAALVPDRGSST